MVRGSYRARHMACALVLSVVACVHCDRKPPPAPAAAAANTATVPGEQAEAATPTDLAPAATGAGARFDPAQPSAATLAERTAIEQIGEAAVYSAQAEARLAAALRHPDQDVRGHACWGLGRMAPQTQGQIAALVTALADPIWSVQHNAGWALVRFGQPAVPALDAALRDGGPAVRARAALALLEIAPDYSARCEVALLAVDVTADPQLGGAVLTGLGKLQQPSEAALERLRQAVAGDQAEAALGAIGALGAKAASAAPDVAKALESKSKAVRQRAAATAGSLGTVAPVLLDALVVAVSDKDEHLAAEAAGALSRLDAVDALKRVATTAAVPARALAITAAGTAPQWSAARLALLMTAAADEAWQVRLSAVAAFVGRPESTTAPAKAMLKRALADGNDAVRDQAKAVLAAPPQPPTAGKGSQGSKGAP